MKINKIIFSIVCILLIQNLFGQENIKVEGRLIWNLADFQGFYGLDKNDIEVFKRYTCQTKNRVKR